MDVHFAVFDVGVKRQGDGYVIRFAELNTHNQFVSHLSEKTVTFLVEAIKAAAENKATD